MLRGTIGDRLGEARRRSFVGRSDELARLRAVLRGSDSEASLLFVHGPGGVGKSALLDAFADLARAESVEVVRVDGRMVEAAGQDLVAALEKAVHATTGQPSLDALGTRGQTLLMIDTYEAIASTPRGLSQCSVGARIARRVPLRHG